VGLIVADSLYFLLSAEISEFIASTNWTMGKIVDYHATIFAQIEI
jgi:hypothetical protein